MKVSIVICTYNGERFVEEQIKSIYNQTRIPNEVIICDDSSTDKTATIIKQFIKQNDLSSSWRFEINRPAKGCSHNFIDAANSAKGDIVFFCDQDDIWDLHKVEYMLAGFEEHSDMLACYCLEQYVDEQGCKVKSNFDFMHNVKMWKTGFVKVSFAENIKKNKCPGLCLAFKKNILEELTPMIYENKLMHDLSIGNYASFFDGLYVLNKKLVKYRQHSTNLSSPKITVSSRIRNIDYQIKGRIGRLKQYKAFYDCYSDRMSEKQIKYFKAMLNSTEKSIVHMKKRNVFALLFQIFSINPFINRWISINNFLCVLYECWK